MGTTVPIVDYLVLDDGEPHLVSNVCETCGARYFDRRNACAKCGGRTFGKQRLGTRGVIRSFTIVHRAALGVPAPFVSAVVDLDGGGMVKADVVGIEPLPDQVALGQAVRLTTYVAGSDSNGTEAVAFGFEKV